MQHRAMQDFKIWQQAVNRSPVIVTPKLNHNQIFFWKELFRLYNIPIPPIRVTKDELYPYTYHRGICIAYSGGLESAVIKHSYPFIPIFEYLKSNVFEWTNPIQPALMIYGAGLGYYTTLYGSELNEGWDNSYEERDELMHSYVHELWLNYSGGASFISPVINQTKHDLFKIAMRDKIPFYSCFSDSKSKAWCGKCYKCLVVHKLYEVEKLQPPFKLRITPDEILSGKTNEIERETYRLLCKKQNH